MGHGYYQASRQGHPGITWFIPELKRTTKTWEMASTRHQAWDILEQPGSFWDTKGQLRHGTWLGPGIKVGTSGTTWVILGHKRTTDTWDMASTRH